VRVMIFCRATATLISALTSISAVAVSAGLLHSLVLCKGLRDTDSFLRDFNLLFAFHFLAVVAPFNRNPKLKPCTASGGRVFAFGHGVRGQLGTGGTSDSWVPIRLKPLNLLHLIVGTLLRASQRPHFEFMDAFS